MTNRYGIPEQENVNTEMFLQRRTLSDLDVDSIARWLGDAQIVLLGEATHGTREFYQVRADITRRLIEAHNFSAVAVEADWPDAHRVHRYVLGDELPGGADAALGGFERFPQWMWRNREVKSFVSWMREWNRKSRKPANRAGFYGLDLYSLQLSMRAVVDYLERVDPEAAHEARMSYACFDHFDSDVHGYAWAARHLPDGPCEDVVVRELLDLRAREARYLETDGAKESEDYFQAEQNARVARNAERYYRTMFRGRVVSWNVRDRHMAETLDEIVQHLTERHRPAKVVVWAHNSHIGDARATEVGREGELNLGQLVRERYGSRCKLVGFTTYSGTVTAASDWDAPAERKRVTPALNGSYEQFLHQIGRPAFFLPLRGAGAAEPDFVPADLLERAIGVVYRPDTERASHYFHANLSEQFDAIVHIDETSAVQPLETTAQWEAAEAPETFPSGI